MTSQPAENNNSLDAMRAVVSQVLGAGEDEAGGRSNARAEILIHSMPVFAQRGLHRTTVQHLLDAANISRRTFYKYFRNKLDVLESLYRISVENMIILFRQQVRQSRTVQEIIHNCIDTYFDYHVSMGAIIRLMQEEALRSESVLAPHRERGHQEAVTILSEEIGKLLGRRLDTLVYRTLLWNLENYSLYLLNETDCSERAVRRCKRVMTGVAEAMVVGAAEPHLLDAETDD